MKNTLIGASIIVLFFTMTPLNAHNEQIGEPIVVSEQNSMPMAFLPALLSEAVDTLTAVPVLIPFNKSLFDRYCLKQAEFYGVKGSYLPLALSLVPIFFGPYALYEGYFKTQEVFGKFKNTVTTSHGIRWVLDTGWYGGYCLYRIRDLACISLAITAGAIFLYKGTQKLLKKDYAALQNRWEAYMIAPMAEQEEKWHTIVYEKFGKPVVLHLDTIYDGASINLVFHKENGAGCVSFDPCDREQVEILLGIHEKKHDDLRCKQLSIMPVFKQ